MGVLLRDDGLEETMLRRFDVAQDFGRNADVDIQFNIEGWINDW
jgi:hypothetical protein